MDKVLKQCQPSEKSDTIYRRDAIDALGEEPEVWTGKDEYAQGLNNQWHYDVNALKAVPSAQPAPCEFCKHNNIADDKACLMCSAERRTDEAD